MNFLVIPFIHHPWAVSEVIIETTLGNFARILAVDRYIHGKTLYFSTRRIAVQFAKMELKNLLSLTDDEFNLLMEVETSTDKYLFMTSALREAINRSLHMPSHAPLISSIAA